MSKLCAIPGKCYELATALNTTANNVTLDIDGRDDLLAALADGKFTYMLINDGVTCEYVKVEANSAGNALVITDRGLEWTSATTFNKGSKVRFEWFNTALDAYMDCRAEDAADENAAPIKIPNYTSEYDEESGQWCYTPTDPAAANGVSWTVGKTTYTFKDGVVSTEAATSTLVPGTYTNATVVIGEDCELKSVTTGDKPLYTPSVSDKCC